MDTKNAYSLSKTGVGSPYLDDLEVLELAANAALENCIVQSVEAFRIDTDGDTPMIQYSILGLEKESEWGKTNHIPTMLSLLRRKLQASRSETNEMRFKVWVREAAPPSGVA